MGTRRQGREAAFQLIYQIDLSGVAYEESVDGFMSQIGVSHKSREFVAELAGGVAGSLQEIDDIISGHSHHWKLHRMNSVDKNVLRLGVYELLFCQETPVKVIINEAIEIAKKYGTAESGSFINGILDKIAKEARPDAKE